MSERRLPIVPILSSLPYLLLALLVSLGCGSRSTLHDSDAGPYPAWGTTDDEDSGPNNATDAGSDPADSDDGRPLPPSGAEGFGPVCRDFLAMFNGTSDKQACLTCITNAQKGQCYADYLAASDYDEPCGRANDCASINCVCGTQTCRPGLCSCILGCMRSAPDECIDRWTSLWACVRRACDSGC